MNAKDVEALRSAIFREQLPRWSNLTKGLLFLDAAAFLIGSVGHLAAIRFSESLVALSLVVVVATLASATKPKSAGLKLATMPVSPDTITTLRAQLSPHAFEHLIVARSQDEQGLLRVAHLQSLAQANEVEQLTAFGQTK